MFEYGLAENNIVFNVFVQVQSTEQMLFNFFILGNLDFLQKVL